MPTSQSDKTPPLKVSGRPIPVDKRIVITMGDAAGIGPEVIVKALGSERLRGKASYLVVGERWVIEEEFAREKEKGDFEILNMGCIGKEDFQRGLPNEITGRASLEYIKRGVEIVKEVHLLSALVTAPVSKAAVNKALPFGPFLLKEQEGPSFRIEGLGRPLRPVDKAGFGHTEFLAELTGARLVRMMLIGGPLKVVLVTTHLPLREVASSITMDSVLKTIEITVQTLRRYFDITVPRIGVCGLNPHLGDGGVLGEEEEAIIRPAIDNFRKKNPLDIRLLPGDTIFHQAYKGAFDAIIGMYHDQVLGPLKMIAFDKGVNFTLGLPFIRTSPDHGVAVDIAGKGKAKPGSMVEAIDFALKILRC